MKAHFILPGNDKKTFFTSTDQRGYTFWTCQNICDALSYVLDNIYIRFGNTCKLCRQIIGIPMGTNCAPLEADLFLIFYVIIFLMMTKPILLRHLTQPLDI